MNEKLKYFLENGYQNPEKYGVYAKSVHMVKNMLCFEADFLNRDVLVAEQALGFHGESFCTGEKTWTIAEHTPENGALLRTLFPFTAPVRVMQHPRTFGVGDRLGIATPGHIRAFESNDVFPVFAQQSMRELYLTGRSYETVLDCASFAVFRENYTQGFGADGDHLKNLKEIQYAIDCGYSMITLDCSEHIHNEAATMTDAEILAAYTADPALERKYLGRTFVIEGYEITFDKISLARASLLYNDMIKFAGTVYEHFFRGEKRTLDFEISIDETDTPTSPAQHFYVANELADIGVRPDTLAPRFIGQFQKGIDYIGDVKCFEEDFKIHAAIARAFNYRISVHSGSDKFSVFPVIGKHTKGAVHVKTAGTNWLEAMKIVAKHAPELYRKCHQFALDGAFEQARAYYVVTTDLNRIPPLPCIQDEELPALFENNDARQLIHITYGNILGQTELRQPLFDTWRTYRAEYEQALYKHITHHMELIWQNG